MRSAALGFNRSTVLRHMSLVFIVALLLACTACNAFQQRPYHCVGSRSVVWRQDGVLGSARSTALAGLSDWFAGLFKMPEEPPPYDAPYKLTDAAWRAKLSGEEFYVLRQAGTERPFTSPLNDEKRAGIFSCKGCGTPLFASDTKFNSGTGWPSFWQPITDTAVVERTDQMLGIKRTEVLCSNCGGHLGHVFADGPRQKTGLRYCINGVALQRVASDQDTQAKNMERLL